jgi:hypothetical protein
MIGRRWWLYSAALARALCLNRVAMMSDALVSDFDKSTWSFPLCSEEAACNI